MSSFKGGLESRRDPPVLSSARPGLRLPFAPPGPPLSEEGKPPLFYLYKCAWWGLMETSSRCFHLKPARGAEGAAESERKWHLGLFALLLPSQQPLSLFPLFFFFFSSPLAPARFLLRSLFPALSEIMFTTRWLLSAGHPVCPTWPETAAGGKGRLPMPGPWFQKEASKSCPRPVGDRALRRPSARPLPPGRAGLTLLLAARRSGGLGPVIRLLGTRVPPLRQG